MQSLYLLYNKIIINSSCRQFQTGVSLGARLGRKNRVRIQSQAGFEKAIAGEGQHEEDFLYGEDEEEGADFNFMQANKAYDEHNWEQKRARKELRNILTAKKFFEPKKQPQMLTHAERQCIKHLHEKDPIHWDVETLSNSFPATTDIIRKILKARYERSPEKQKALDRKVQKNWELLAKGALDADPDFIKHLQKFINRRHAILDQLNADELYLPENKTKNAWNMGEMSSILANYEKSINLLVKAQEQEAKRSLLPVSQEEEKPVDANEEKSSLEAMHEKINKIASIRDIEGAESFLLRKMINRHKEKLTFEELEQSIIDKADRDMELKLEERAILESKLGSKNSVNKPTSQKEKKHTKFLSAIVDKKTTCSVSESSETEDIFEIKQEKSNFSRYLNNKFHLENENKYIPPDPDENTILISDYALGNKLNDEGKFKVNQENNHAGKKTERRNRVLDPEAQKRKELFYEKEVEDLKNTAFWDGRMTSKDKALLETAKEPLGPPKEYKNVTVADVSVINDYPKRIEIPKSKIGSGLIFKVKDCYYDDDGEFLYRVPGMTK